MTVGYLADSFDLINVRDLDLIAQARAQCSRLVLGVFTDDYAEQIFGRRPVVPLAERILLVSHVRGVAEVVAHDAGAASLLVSADLVFNAGDVPVQVGDHPVVLSPRRRTESDILRNALQAIDRESADEAVA